MNEPAEQTIAPDELPEVIRTYLHARAVGDVDRALEMCLDEATLVDVDVVHRGRDAIRAVLSRPIAERNLTFEVTNATKVSDDRYDVTNRIDGDLEGGPYDLRYHFTLRRGRIEFLYIEL